MSKIFIYFSLNADGDCVAEVLEKHKFHTKRVQMVKPPKDNEIGFSLKMAAKMGKKAEIEPFDLDVTEYDEVYFGAPVWGEALATPMNTVLEQFESQLDHCIVNFILYNETGSAEKLERKLEDRFNAQVYVLKNPSRNDNELASLEAILL